MRAKTMHNKIYIDIYIYIYIYVPFIVISSNATTAIESHLFPLLAAALLILSKTSFCNPICKYPLLFRPLRKSLGAGNTNTS